MKRPRLLKAAPLMMMEQVFIETALVFSSVKFHAGANKKRQTKIKYKPNALLTTKTQRLSILASDKK